MIHPRFESMVRYVEGELGTRGRARVAAHVLRCDRCRAALREVEAVKVALQVSLETAPPELLARIHATRSAGVRVLVPDGTPHRHRPVRRLTRIIGVGVAAVLAVVALTQDDSQRGGDCMRTGLGRLLPVSVFGVAFACAEGPAALPDSAYQVVDRLTDRIVPGVYRYQQVMWTDDLVESPQGEMMINFSSSTWNGEPVWTAVTQATHRYHRPSEDTVVFAQGTLAPRYHVGNGFRRSMAVGDSVRRADGARWTDGRTRFVELGFARGRTVFPTSVAHQFAAFTGFPVDYAWAGKFEEGQYVVVGRETITVPAGTFDCWRVERRGSPVEWRGWLDVNQSLVVKWEVGSHENRWETSLTGFELQ